MSNTKMTMDEAIQYLQPIADSASLPRHAEALNIAIDAMQHQKDHVADDGKKVYAHWIEYRNPVIGRYFTCSNCGKDENHHTAVKGRYCWNCGAKMDGEVEHGKPISN